MREPEGAIYVFIQLIFIMHLLHAGLACSSGWGTSVPKMETCQAFKGFVVKSREARGPGGLLSVSHLDRSLACTNGKLVDWGR